MKRLGIARAGALLAMVLAASVLVAAPACAAPLSHGSRSLPSASTRGIGVVRLGTSYSPRQGYNRYGYVIVGVGDAAAGGALKAKSLVYMSGTSITTRFFTGVGYKQARKKGWLLKDVGGDYLHSHQYESTYIADVGNPAYQKQWAHNVARFLTRHGNDGVFIDDVIADIKQLSDHAYPAEYPNWERWQAAELSFVKYVGRALKRKGFYVLVSANAYVAGDARSNSGELTGLFWRSLSPYVSGLFSEYWLQLPTDTSTLRAVGSSTWQQWWGRWQGLVGVAQAAGVDFFAEMYGAAASMDIARFGRASFLLDWNGKGGAFIYTADEGSTDPWNPEWTMQIGKPIAPKRKAGVGWRRDYSRGVALVNPSATTSQTFRFASAYYRADGNAVKSITLPPTSGVILRRPAKHDPG